MATLAPAPHSSLSISSLTTPPFSRVSAELAENPSSTVTVSPFPLSYIIAAAERHS